VRRLFFIVLLLLLVGWLLTGLTSVKPGERAVVRRFGKVVREVGAGLHVGWPWGIERVDRVAVDQVRRVTVGFQPGAEDSGVVTPPGQLLTGDHNLINMQVVVDYAVQPDHVDDFVVQAARVDGLVARAAESAVAEWVAGRNVDDVLLTSKATLPAWLVRQTQQRVDPYRLGVQVQAASIAYLLPPEDVRPAFDDVTRAQTAIRTQEHEARQTADSKRREAAWKRFQTEQQAAAYVNERLRLAQTEADIFTKRRQQYQRLRQQNPDILAAIWWDEMGKVFERLSANGRIDVLDHRIGPDGLDITQFPPRKK
jgi:membrane protease subunit HflK